MSVEVERLVLTMEANMRNYERSMARMQQKTNEAAGRVENRFRQQQRTIEGTFAGIQRNATRMLGLIGVGVSAQVFTRMISDSLQLAETMVDTADRVGFTVEQLQELRFAADQNGSSARTLDMALQRFSRRTGEAAQGTGELNQTIIDLGIELRNADGTMRDSYDILLDYADAIQNAESDQEALRLAFKAFDSEGAQLVTLMRQGRDGVQEFGQRAREASQVMGNDLARNAAEANRVLRETRGIISGEFNQAVAENAEAIRDMGRAFGEMAAAAVRAGSDVARFFRHVDRLQEDPQYAQETALRGQEAAMQFAIESLEGQLEAAQRMRDLAEREDDAPQFLLARDLVNDVSARLDRARASLAGLRQSAEAFDETMARGAGFAAMREAEMARNAPPPAVILDPDDDGSAQSYGEDAGEAFARTIEAMGPPEWVLQGLDAIRYGQTLYDEGLARQEAEREAQMRAQALVEAQRAEYHRAREDFSREFAHTFASGMQAAFDGRLQDFLKQRLRDAMFNAMMEAFSAIGRRVFDQVLGSIGGGGFPFGGARMSGGGVSPGKSYTVGERGPETFVPGMRGSILPNPQSLQGRASGGGGTVRIMLHVGEGPEFATRVAEITGPMVSDGVQVAVQTSRAEIGADMANRQMRSLR